MTEFLYTLIMTHITIVAVTLYLHRGQSHRGIIFHPILSHSMRLWLWLTTGMVTREWVAVHRLHHRHADRPGDPHSPHVYGIGRVLFGGVLLYSAATRDRDMVAQYGAGTPDDWMERNVYSRYSLLGVMLLLIFNTWLFHGWGIVIWLIQMAWIPFWAAGVINGLGHWIGYRNEETRDCSRNIVPWGIWIGGEELHNNHHIDPGSVKFSRLKSEFDLGYAYLKMFCWLRLAQIR